MSAVSLSVRVDAGVIEHNNRVFVAKNVNKDKIADNITYINTLLYLKIGKNGKQLFDESITKLKLKWCILCTKF